MLANYALMPIFGYPALMYGGIITFLLTLFVALVGLRTHLGKCKFKNPVKVHMTLAIIVIILALIHGILGMAIFMGF